MLAFSAVVFLLLGYIYWATTNYVLSRADRAIAADRTILVQAYGRGGREGLIRLINQRIAARDFEGSIYLLADSRFAVLAGNLKAWPAALRAGDERADFVAPERKLSAAERPLVRAASGTLPDGSHLLVGRTIDDLDEFIGAMKIGLAWGAALTFVLAAVAGAFVTRRTVGRIETINATTQDIMRSGLSKRIPLRGTKDEWDQLAANLNAMLDRIEELVRDLKQVSDNVAHDLRTPLTRLQGRLERAYHQPDSERYHVLIGDTIDELKGILGTFSSLLRISRIEALDPRSTFRTVDLSEIASEVAELFDAAAEEKCGHVKLISRGRVSAWGDRDLLFEAISNLIDNAIKHGDKGDVVVEAVVDGSDPVISVADYGPGIPPEERQHVFKRFYRLDRSRNSPGNGLGLSLVAAVAALHGAIIAMADNEPGLKIQLRFPPARVASSTVSLRQPDAPPPPV